MSKENLDVIYTATNKEQIELTFRRLPRDVKHSRRAIGYEFTHMGKDWGSYAVPINRTKKEKNAVIGTTLRCCIFRIEAGILGMEEPDIFDESKEGQKKIDAWLKLDEKVGKLFKNIKNVN